MRSDNLNEMASAQMPTGQSDGQHYLLPGPIGDFLRGLGEKYFPYSYHQGMTKPGLLGGGNPMENGGNQMGGPQGNNYQFQQGMLGGGNPMAGGGQIPFTPGYTFGNKSPNYGYQTNPVSGGLGGGLGSGIFGSIGSMFGGMNSKNPYDDAMKYLSQISGMANQNFNPYIQAGITDMGKLQEQYGKLVNDPGALMASLGKGFQSSPGYQFNVNQATNAANNAAAAGGMLGSGAHQFGIAQDITGLANQDYNNYLNHALGMYGQGLGGMQGIMQQGYGASSQLANMLSQALRDQAQTAAGGADWKNQNNMNMWGNIGGLIDQLFRL